MLQADAACSDGPTYTYIHAHKTTAYLDHKMLFVSGSVKCCMTGPAFEVVLQADVSVLHAVTGVHIHIYSHIKLQLILTPRKPFLSAGVLEVLHDRPSL